MKINKSDITKKTSDKQESNENSFELLEKKVDNYITKKKVWDKTRKLSLQSLILILAVVISLIYADEIKILIKKVIINDVDYLLTDEVRIVKQSLINEIPINYFSNSKNNKDVFENPTQFIYLINRFNNDFYGKVYNLTINDEQQLYTFVTYAGINISDLSKINRALVGDSSKTIKEWLIAKTIKEGPFSPYYNPIFNELVNDIASIKAQLNAEFSIPIPESIRDSVKNFMISNHKENDNDSQLKADVISFFKNSRQYLKKEIEIARLLGEKEQELNIRLGLFYIYLGKEYEAGNNGQMFGWLKNNIRGINYFDTKGKLREKAHYDARFENDYYKFSASLKETKKIYNKMELGAGKVQLYNPLRIPLEVKRIGLFGSRRKSNYGRLYNHRGIDFIAEEGTLVYAVKGGFVIYVGNKRNGFGNQIKILHDNKVVSLYAHLKKDKVWQRTYNRYKEEGSFWVDSLLPIASVGSSGNIPKNDAQYGYSHLHLEIEIDGKLKNPFQMFNNPIQVY